MVNFVLFGMLSFSTLVVASPLSLSSIDTRQWDNPTPPSPPSDLVAPSPQLAPTDTNSYFPIPPDLNVPEGYSMGFSTQDWEPIGQQSICTTNCQLAHPFSTTAGPALPFGVYAGAAGPSIIGGADECTPCGSCYHIVHSGTPYCSWNDPACYAPSGPQWQAGPKSIKLMITNHCMNCDDIPGHFDVNFSPAGWDNPRIFWKKVDDWECWW